MCYDNRIRMKNYLLSISLIASSTISYSQNIVIENDIVYIYGMDYSLVNTTGSDGFQITYPIDWCTTSGSDGRVIAYPCNWCTTTGSDGRVTAYPCNLCTTSGSDGRVIGYPCNLCTTSGNDGRVVAYPCNLCTTSGSDGRVIAYSCNLCTTSGNDGRVIAYPCNWCTTTEKNGRKFAYPCSWSVMNNNGQKCIEIDEVIGGIALAYSNAEASNIIQKLKDDDRLEKNELADYALYLFINNRD